MCHCLLQLASDAANLIAMTEEEKKRLEDLLVDVDNIPDLPENMEDMVGYCLLWKHAYAIYFDFYSCEN